MQKASKCEENEIKRKLNTVLKYMEMEEVLLSCYCRDQLSCAEQLCKMFAVGKLPFSIDSRNEYWHAADSDLFSPSPGACVWHSMKSSRVNYLFNQEWPHLYRETGSTAAGSLLEIASNFLQIGCLYMLSLINIINNCMLAFLLISNSSQSDCGE